LGAETLAAVILGREIGDAYAPANPDRHRNSVRVRIVEHSAQARPSADFYDVNLSVVTQLAPVDSANTKVVTTVDAMARPVSFGGEYIRCATTGEIESRISSMLRAVATR